MSRSRRVSRPLIAVLAAVLLLGLFFYLHNLKRVRAVEAVAPPDESSRASSPPVTSLPPAHPAAAPIVALKPAQGVVAQQPATQPVALITQTPALQSTGASASPSSRQLAGAESATPTTQHSDARAGGAPLSKSAVTSSASKATLSDLLASRDSLNESLISGKAAGAEAEAARKSLSEINQTVIFSPRKFADDPFGGIYAVQSGERLGSIASKNGVSWEFLARINGIDPRRLRSGSSIKIIKGPFHAVVYKSLFRMDLYLGAPGGTGSMYVTSYPVGLGKDGSTPSGAWKIQEGNKIRHPKYYSPRGEGVIDADDPKNPLGGYWLGLVGLDGQAVGKESYGVHGTIDPNSIGRQESMGCIRLRNEDIAVVFDLLIEGKSKVIVKD